MNSTKVSWIYAWRGHAYVDVDCSAFNPKVLPL